MNLISRKRDRFSSHYRHPAEPMQRQRGAQVIGTAFAKGGTETNLMLLSTQKNNVRAIMVLSVTQKRIPTRNRKLSLNNKQILPGLELTTLLTGIL
jgi:hypothetical protein